MAPKVSGRIQRLLVDVSDPVVRGQVVVQMENEEFKQEVIEAEARLAVAEANRDEAVNHFVIAKRQLDRAKTLNARGIASESAYDSVQAQFLTGQSAVKVAEANLKREDALLRAARIRLGYTEVKADWQQGDNERTVAERFVDEGNTVAANTPILSIVEIDPVLSCNPGNRKRLSSHQAGANRRRCRRMVSQIKFLLELFRIYRRFFESHPARPKSKFILPIPNTYSNPECL